MNGLYHGGAPGFRVGDLILPHETKHIDDCPTCAARADENHAPDRVFATPVRIYGKFYASKWVGGSLYLVAPEGDCERSVADSIETYQAPALRVLRVSETNCLLTMSERRKLHRLWAAADRSAGYAQTPGAMLADLQLKRALGFAPTELR